MEKKHLLYKTTNVLTSKYYIGVHSTMNTNDGYLGSGVLLQNSIKKYGKEAHKIEILEEHLDRASLIAREAEIVTQQLLQDPLCMNLMLGGTAASYPAPATTRERMSLAATGKKRGAQSEKHKTAIAVGKRKSEYKPTEETKKKISASRSGKKISEEAKQRQLTAMRSPEVKWKIGSASRGKPGHNRKPVVINGIHFSSISEAQIALNCSYKAIQKQIKSAQTEKVQL